VMTVHPIHKKLNQKPSRNRRAINNGFTKGLAVQSWSP
jgi:hypothetical protein